MINTYIAALAEYGLKTGLITADDRIFAVNSILAALGLDDYEEPENIPHMELEEILKGLLDFACSKNIIPDSIAYRDLFDTKLMACLTPRPSEVIAKFKSDYAVSPVTATDNYYKLSRDSDYIRRYRIAKDIKWKTETEYGELDITINLSKPEKDPRAIAAALKAGVKTYPKCMLCRENEGYMGGINHPARQNHRIIPLNLDGAKWYFQYSPYVYYNEHCIVFDENHTPMKISEDGFRKLFAFIKMFPHYFVGSNSDLPIAGGSILTHEHFQGGNYTFAMAKAPVEEKLYFNGFSDVEAGIVKWPMSVIRLRGENSERLCELSGKILEKWRSYTDEEAFIFAETDGVVHNTITPIARFRDGKYEIDLVLRNNITTKECPDGFYHPHPEYHHIKKENIGLIEVMGLAVLPARLKSEMAELKRAILAGEKLEDNEKISKHAAWAYEIMKNRTLTEENCDEILQDEIGRTFAKILEQCGVFARTERGRAFFRRFVESVGGAAR